MMEVKRASDMDNCPREAMSRLFVDGFYQWLRLFSKDREQLARAFAHMFRLEGYHVAVVDGEIAGMAACVESTASSVSLDRKELRRHLGWLRGTFAGMVLSSQWENDHYPFDTDATMGSVEFVAVSTRHRGQGIGSKIIQQIHDTEPYQKFVLEVADTNTSAVKLYEKLGYGELLRVKETFSRQSGVNYRVYMKYDRQR